MREDFKTRWEERRERRHGQSNVWTGIFIVIIGIAAMVKVSNPDLPHWIFSWKTFLVALGLFIGFKDGFRGGSWLILILVGSAFLVSDIYPDISLRRYIWPGIIIAIGAMLILKPKRSDSCMNSWHGQKKNQPADTGVPEEATVINEPYEEEYREDYVDATSIFGGVKKNVISKNFRGGELVSIFGGTELDLTRADFKGTAVIELTTIFGGTKLVVPSNWTVKSDAVTIFGGMEDKRHIQTLTNNPEKTLLIKGTVIFGGIEIKSF